jgi:hypothetical protein
MFRKYCGLELMVAFGLKLMSLAEESWNLFSRGLLA